MNDIACQATLAFVAESKLLVYNVSYGVAGYCIVGFGARAVSRKTPTYFILTHLQKKKMLNI